MPGSSSGSRGFEEQKTLTCFQVSARWGGSTAAAAAARSWLKRVQAGKACLWPWLAPWSAPAHVNPHADQACDNRTLHLHRPRCEVGVRRKLETSFRRACSDRSHVRRQLLPVAVFRLSVLISAQWGAREAHSASAAPLALLARGSPKSWRRGRNRSDWFRIWHERLQWRFSCAAVQSVLSEGHARHAAPSSHPPSYQCSVESTRGTQRRRGSTGTAR
jgi:hypothetical protein